MIGRLTLLAAALAIPGAVQAKSYPPRNECARSAEAVAFQRALTTAVVNRNEDMLAGLVAPEILLDFGGGSGADELRARLDHPDYRLWQELDQILRLGCALKDEGTLVMPWLWAQDLGLEDPFGSMLVLGAGIPLLQRADVNAPVVGRLDWDMVLLLDEYTDAPDALLQVRTASGRKGYVAKKHLRSLVDYRLLAERDEAGNYRTTIFVAGD